MRSRLARVLVALGCALLGPLSAVSPSAWKPAPPPAAQARRAPDPVALLLEANARMKALDWLAYDFEYVGMYALAGSVRGHAVVSPGSSFLDLSFVADLELGMPPNGLLRMPRRTTMALADGKARDDELRKVIAGALLKGR